MVIFQFAMQTFTRPGIIWHHLAGPRNSVSAEAYGQFNPEKVFVPPVYPKSEVGLRFRDAGLMVVLSRAPLSLEIHGFFWGVNLSISATKLL